MPLWLAGPAVPFDFDVTIHAYVSSGHSPFVFLAGGITNNSAATEERNLAGHSVAEGHWNFFFEFLFLDLTKVREKKNILLAFIVITELLVSRLLFCSKYMQSMTFLTNYNNANTFTIQYTFILCSLLLHEHK